MIIVKNEEDYTIKPGSSLYFLETNSHDKRVNTVRSDC